MRACGQSVRLSFHLPKRVLEGLKISMKSKSYWRNGCESSFYVALVVRALPHAQSRPCSTSSSSRSSCNSTCGTATYSFRFRHLEACSRWPRFCLTNAAKQHADMATAPQLTRTGYLKVLGLEKTMVDAKDRSSNRFCSAISAAENLPRWAAGVDWLEEGVGQYAYTDRIHTLFRINEVTYLLHKKLHRKIKPPQPQPRSHDPSQQSRPRPHTIPSQSQKCHNTPADPTEQPVHRPQPRPRRPNARHKQRCKAGCRELYGHGGEAHQTNEEGVVAYGEEVSRQLNAGAENGEVEETEGEGGEEGGAVGVGAP